MNVNSAKGQMKKKKIFLTQDFILGTLALAANNYLSSSSTSAYNCRSNRWYYNNACTQLYVTTPFDEEPYITINYEMNDDEDDN